MTQVLNPLQNPNSPEALTVSDILPGVNFRVINEEGGEVVAGTFTSGAVYDGEEHGWHGAKAVLVPDGEEQPIDVYRMGIACSPQGKWSGSFTVRQALKDEPPQDVPSHSSL